MQFLLLLAVTALLAVAGPGSAIVEWVINHLVLICFVVLLYCAAPAVLLHLTEGHICGELDRSGRLLPCRAKRSQHRFAYEGRLCPAVQRQITLRRLVREIIWFWNEVGRVWNALCGLCNTCCGLWKEIQAELEPMYRVAPIYFTCAWSTPRSAAAYVPVSPFVFMYRQFVPRVAGPLAEIWTSAIHASKDETEEWTGASLQEEYGALVEKSETKVLKKPSVKVSGPNWDYKPSPRRLSETTKAEPQAIVSTIAPKAVKTGRKPTMVKPKRSAVKPKSTLAVIKPAGVVSKPVVDVSKPVASSLESATIVPPSTVGASKLAMVVSKPSAAQTQLPALKPQSIIVDCKPVPVVPKSIAAAPSAAVSQSNHLVVPNLPVATPQPMETKSEPVIVAPNLVVASPDPITSAAKPTAVTPGYTPTTLKPVVAAAILTAVSPKSNTDTALRPICLKRQAALAAISQRKEEHGLEGTRPEKSIENQKVCSMRKEASPLPTPKSTHNNSLLRMAEGNKVATIEPANMANTIFNLASPVAPMDVPSRREEVPKPEQTEEDSSTTTASSLLSASSQESLASNCTSSTFEQSFGLHNFTSANTTTEDAPLPNYEPTPCFLLPLPTPAQLAELTHTTFNQPKDARKDLTLKSPKHKTLARNKPIYAPLLQLPTIGGMLGSVITRAEQRKKHAIRKAKLVRRSMRAVKVAAPVSLVKSFPCVSNSVRSGGIIPAVSVLVGVAEPMVCDARLEPEAPMDVTTSMDVVTAPVMDAVEQAQPMDGQVTMEVSAVPQAPTMLAIPTPVVYSPILAPAELTSTVPTQPVRKVSSPTPRVSAFPPVSVLPRMDHAMPCKPMDAVSYFKSQKPKRVQPDPDAKLATAPTQSGACRALGRVEAPRVALQKQVIWSLDKDGKDALPEKGVAANTYIWRRDPSLGTPAVRVRAPKMFLVTG
ncbi:hypothetical protein BDV93DRAFT_559587 [Ceratobasidium sp. AG-I]|nr:hypothetical protein BDV93DRAFT_559587 [Ceratobasidium sp. AG-I]